MSAAEELQDLTHYCKATADQQRLQILRVLSRESFGVLELCSILDVAQPALSHHLKILANAELVETRRQGTSIYYRRALVHLDDPFRGLRQSLFDTMDQTSINQKVEARIKTIYDTRHIQAKSFFEKNAHLFQENQNLIAEYADYSQCITDVLDNEQFNTTDTVVEVGPGDSDLILALADRFAHITAIDNNQEMLGKSRIKSAINDKKNVTFQSGELHDFQGSCELIVLNMVLHHLAAPVNFFHVAKRCLSSQGKILIIELCAHDQDWTRDTCGDLWLGFDPAELDTWAMAAGFKQGQSVYLGLKNGFQVQVRTYQPEE